MHVYRGCRSPLGESAGADAEGSTDISSGNSIRRLILFLKGTCLLVYRPPRRRTTSKSRFAEEQTFSILKEAEARVSLGELYPRRGSWDAAFHN